MNIYELKVVTDKWVETYYQVSEDEGIRIYRSMDDIVRDVTESFEGGWGVNLNSGGRVNFRLLKEDEAEDVRKQIFHMIS